MKKLLFSYSGEEGMQYHTIGEIVQGETVEMGDFVKLEENVNLQEFYLSKNNLDKIMELDNSFHKMMYQISNKMRCYYMVRLMNIHHDRIRELHLHTSNPANIIEEHKEILEALRNRDSDKAETLIREHLTRVYTQEADIRKKFGEYFVS